MHVMLLAQVVETAEKTVGVLERIQAGGALLITLCFLAVVGFVCWWVLRRNAALERQNAVTEREWREAVAKAEGEYREAIKKDANARREETVALMREMLVRDKELTDVTGASARAIEGFNAVIKEQNRLIDDMKDALQQLSIKFGAVQETKEQVTQLTARITTLSETVRDLRTRS